MARAAGARRRDGACSAALVRGRHLTLALVVMLCVAVMGRGAPQDKKERFRFGRWGAEALLQIDKDLKVGALYAEWATADGKKGSEHGRFSFVWPASFQLRALAAAAKVYPRGYRKRLSEFAGPLQGYWSVKHGVGGYAVLPGSSERYYDDNAWMLLGLIDTYEATRQKTFLARAVQVLEFLQSGEKKTEGGGIRQHEDKPGGIFTCSAAPAAVGALRLHLIRRNPKYVAFAERMYAALMSEEIGLRDPQDGLFHQWAKKEDGSWKVEYGKRAYQSSLPLQLNVLLYQVRKDESYLDESKRIAESATERWIRSDGSFEETGQWGGSDLCDALLDLYEVDKNPRWLETVRRVAEFLHEKGRDPNGRYGEEWHVVRTDEALEKVHLLYMAPVARAFWRVAAYERR